MDKFESNQYKNHCLNFFLSLKTNFRQHFIVEHRKCLHTEPPRYYEFKNDSKTRRYLLHPKTSPNCNSSKEIFGWVRPSWTRPFRTELRWGRPLRLQTCRSQSLQLQFSRCNFRSSLTLESQSLLFQSQWSIIGWNRSRMVQPRQLDYSPSQYSKNDPSSSVPIWKGDL